MDGSSIFAKYKDSNKMATLKKQYEAKNMIPEADELNEQTNRGAYGKYAQKKKEFLALKEKTIEKVPALQELNDINAIVAADANELGRDEVAENSFESLVTFNTDMKVLALSAYQLNDLLNLVIDEHQQLNDWLQRCENETIATEENVYTCGKTVQLYVKDFKDKRSRREIWPLQLSNQLNFYIYYKKSKVLFLKKKVGKLRFI